MKKYNLILISLFSFFCLLFNMDKVFGSLPLSGLLIIVDPGHGGKDPGTLAGIILEKDINLNISLNLENELTKLGANVILTRKGDYDLSKPNAYWRKRSDFDNRIKLINESKADLYLSIHLNYLHDLSYSGAQVFYSKDNEKLAEIIQKNINKNLSSNRKIKQIPSSTYMYSKIKVKGVLIECGFLSNSKEKLLLNSNDYQKKVAKVIAYSLIDYF